MAEEKAPPAEECKCKETECPVGAPAWMITYSDLVTLLLTFFVLMLSMANMDPVKVLQASSSMREAFGMHSSPSRVEFTIPILPSAPKAPYNPIVQKQTEKVYEKIKSMIDSLRLNKQLGLHKKDDESIVLRINDSLLFERGKAKIAPQAYPLLRTVADIIRPLPMDLRLEGHTDDVPATASKYGNWDLSVDRAVAVMRFYMQSDLLVLDRMSSVGYGPDKPLVPNTDEEARSKNRRVDFVLHLRGNTSVKSRGGGDAAVPL